MRSLLYRKIIQHFPSNLKDNLWKCCGNFFKVCNMHKFFHPGRPVPAALSPSHPPPFVTIQARPSGGCRAGGQKNSGEAGRPAAAFCGWDAVYSSVFSSGLSTAAQRPSMPDSAASTVP